MPTVRIGETDYPVYADIEMADTYLAAQWGADMWMDEDETTKARALISATRLIDQQDWLGVKTDPNQPLQWPRKQTGIAGVKDDDVPPDIVTPTILFANALVDGFEPMGDGSGFDANSVTIGERSMTVYRVTDGVSCCARPTSGHGIAAAPPRSAMSRRRFIRLPGRRGRAGSRAR
jgi:hypothetical protein